MKTRITLRLDFDDTRRLGPGKIALLEAIGKLGSISAAGREFEMSYRRAWRLTAELNHMFESPLVETREGGKNGGGASLTDLGERVVVLYRVAERKVRESTAREIKSMERALGSAAMPDHGSVRLAT